MTVQAAKPVDLFRAEAGTRCPGFLFSFNLADFKRRNIHLGHLVGDADIAELDKQLKMLASESVVVARTGGDQWLLFSRSDPTVRVQALIDSFKRSDQLTTGWRVFGEKGGERASAERVIASGIERAVRCLSAPVATCEALDRAIARMAENDYSLPVNTILALDNLPIRQTWHSVTRYPGENPACPFCGGRDFAWEDGDGSVYTGSGTCKSCGAGIDIRQIS